jgi:hypothetical protein
LLVAAGGLLDLSPRARTRLRTGLERAATVLRFHLEAERRALPSLVQRDLELTARAARRLFERLNDLDNSALPGEIEARREVLLALAEELDRQRSDKVSTVPCAAKADPSAKGRSRDRSAANGADLDAIEASDIDSFEYVTNIVALIRDLAESAERRLAKHRGSLMHERRSTFEEVIEALDQAWRRATDKHLSTTAEGPSGRFVSAFFEHVGGFALSTHQVRRLLRSLRENRHRSV